MGKPAILFFTEVVSFNLQKKKAIRIWLADLIQSEAYQLNHLNIIFCNDKYLHKINLQYLNHNTYTDIITFDNSNVKGVIECDIFISIERIKENAKILKVNFSEECHRVMAHGLLHLCGYKDKPLKAKQVMTAKEDYYLSLRSFL